MSVMKEDLGIAAYTLLSHLMVELDQLNPGLFDRVMARAIAGMEKQMEAYPDGNAAVILQIFKGDMK
ncbi:hypothetical protein QP178_17385 [Sphingomonas aurantiaca]|uniref:hypothetical protein n=1 Tax=Sphingomonas aurantiaca TaxID=185949 RepID=UPI002FE02FC7